MNFDDPERAIPAILSVFERIGEEGGYVYSDREARDFIAATLLTAGFDPAKLSRGVSQLMAGFLIDAGVALGASAEESHQAIARYFEKNPLSPGLVFEVERLVQEERATRDPTLAVRSFERWLAAGKRKLVLPTQTAPAGTIKAGPLTQFRLRTPEDPDGAGG